MAANSTVKKQIKDSTALIENFKNELSRQDLKLVTLRASIRSLEKKLNQRNNSLLINLSRIKEIDASMVNINETIINNEKDVKKIYEELDIVFKTYLANSIDGNDSTIEVAQNRMLMKILNNKLESLKSELGVAETLRAQLKIMQIKFSKLKEVEKVMEDVLTNLELEKKKLAQNYIKTSQLRDSIDYDVNKLDHEIKNKKLPGRNELAISSSLIPESNLNLIFGALKAPIEKYVDYEYDKKGVSFKFNKVLPVKAAGNGRVIYAGKLASYGNIVMIDHGDQLKTILLGEFKLNVSRDAKVSVGDILGHTNFNPLGRKKLGVIYFEVRNKNTAQNTFRWLDSKNLVSKG